MGGRRSFCFLEPFLTGRQPRGFTLLELLTVMLFASILAAVAIPNYLAQASKARQAEAKQVLGTMNRSQQAYRFEKAVFATSLQDLKVVLTVDTDQPDTQQSLYFTYSIDPGSTGEEVHHRAVPKPTYSKDTKNITSAIIRLPGQGDVTALCEGYVSTDLPEISFISGGKNCAGGKLLDEN
jgi:prepilin-type N-terminal cleavage/methylation domain-containing protein